MSPVGAGVVLELKLLARIFPGFSALGGGGGLGMRDGAGLFEEAVLRPGLPIGGRGGIILSPAEETSEGAPIDAR